MTDQSATEPDKHPAPRPLQKIIVPVLLVLFGVLVGALITRGSDRAPSIKAAYHKPAGPLPYRKPQQQEFFRLRRDAAGAPASLETAIAVYTPAGGADLEVALIGAVHIADKEYFAELNREFSRYDRLLYELVAAKDTRPVPGKRRSNDPFSALQNMLPQMLGVAHQLDEIDYGAKNFVHADLSFQDLVEHGKRSGETRFTFLAGIALNLVKMKHQMDLRSKEAGGKAPSMAEFYEVLSDPQRFRVQFAEALGQYDALTGIEGLTTLVPYLITARNDAALKVLDEQIAKGSRRIGIFYGAAHMQDFEKKLITDFGLQLTQSRWLKAWDLTRPVKGKSAVQLFMEYFNDGRPDGLQKLLEHSARSQ